MTLPYPFARIGSTDSWNGTEITQTIQVALSGVTACPGYTGADINGVWTFSMSSATLIGTYSAPVCTIGFPPFPPYNIFLSFNPFNCTMRIAGVTCGAGADATVQLFFNCPICFDAAQANAYTFCGFFGHDNYVNFGGTATFSCS